MTPRERTLLFLALELVVLIAKHLMMAHKSFIHATAHMGTLVERIEVLIPGDPTAQLSKEGNHG